MTLGELAERAVPQPDRAVSSENGSNPCSLSALSAAPPLSNSTATDRIVEAAQHGDARFVPLHPITLSLTKPS